MPKIAMRKTRMAMLCFLLDKQTYKLYIHYMELLQRNYLLLILEFTVKESEF